MKVKIVFIFTLLFLTISCNEPNLVSNILTKSEIIATSVGYFSFNVKNIIMGVESKEDIGLIEISEYQFDNDNSTEQLVKWNQKDYDELLQIVQNQVWRERFNDFTLYSMHFSSKCEEIPDGIQKGLYKFYKIENDQRIERTIIITPKKGLIKWEEKVLSGNTEADGVIDLKRLPKTFNQALSLAENESGKRIRLESGNKCNVYITADINQASPFWKVTYWSWDLNKLEPIYNEIVK